ncbi:hypothetical protein [Halococcoides cellulosivorans]|uniref:hypothetical protein n=1 Tax=Halococcoides cellulosivorans TaxID=1679096 RepID=UPI00131EFD65|nr:hypothetical protein [Halococcoides cellulosivorans]
MDDATATALIVVGVALSTVGLLVVDRDANAMLSIGLQTLGVGVLAVTAVKTMRD